MEVPNFEAQKEARVRVVLVRILQASGKEENSESGSGRDTVGAIPASPLSFGELCIQRRRGVLGFFFFPLGCRGGQ